MAAASRTMRFSSSLGYPPLTEWPHAGRDRSPRDHADTRTLLLHRVAGATLEEIHSGRIRLLLPSKAVVFTRTSGRIVRDSERAVKDEDYSPQVGKCLLSSVSLA